MLGEDSTDSENDSSSSGKVNKLNWLALVSASSIIFLSVMLWKEADRQEQKFIDYILAEESQIISQRVLSSLNSSILSLGRMASRWESRAGTPKVEWIPDAKNYVKDHKSLTTVEWVDSSFHVRWVEPLEGNEKALGLNIAFNDERKNALKNAADENVITLTPPLDLVQGYRAIISYIPIHIEGAFHGFIVGIYDVEKFINNILPSNFGDLYNIRITDRNKIVFKTPVEGNGSGLEPIVTNTIPIFNRTWSVEIWPKPALTQRHITLLPKIILLSGVVFGLFTALSIIYISSARSYGRKLKKKNREVKEAMERAEEAAKLKGEFLANMSHEIRTPMNGVIGMLQIALENNMPSKLKANITTAMSSAHMLLQIINDILDYSKIVAGKLDFEEMPFDLKNVFEENIILMDVQAKDKGLDLQLTFPDDLPRYVIGDPGRIRQILFNLIGNSIKFTQEGSVELDIKLNSSSNKKHDFIVTVKDTGIGIPEDKLDYIFNKFDQADNSTTRQFGGTGLGLSICKELVYMMSGDIGVESKVGEGSLFWFTMQLSSSSQDVVEKNIRNIDENVSEGVTFNNVHILLAEDNIVNQLVASEILQNYGCTVTVTPNGKEAFAHAKEKEFDIIFMDCQMPEMDGFEATGHIKKYWQNKSMPTTPIIAFTANAMRGDRKKCLEAGMDDYISKPIKKEAMQAMLTKWVSSNKQVK